MSIKGKLNRMKNHMKEGVTSEKECPKKNINESSPLLYANDWSSFGTNPFHFENNYSLIRKIHYSKDYTYGNHTFSELEQVVDRWNSFRLDHPLSVKGSSTNDLIFLDTETTGLSRGTGNTIFMIGYARMDRSGVIVKQHFLPSLDGEIAMYQAFLKDIGDLDTVKITSYNGKAFDWPQIKTRHTLIRESVPKLPPFGQIDLLHASRRLWKSELESVKLSIVENEVLQVQRNGDIPGFLAPMLYLDYLKDGNPEGIKGVFSHNEKDVLTLIILYIHLSNRLLDQSFSVCSPREMYEIARWFEYLGELSMACEYYKKISNQDSFFSSEASHALASLYKKNKMYDEALWMWEELAASNSFTAEVAEELAKLYEHQKKDLEKALYYTNKGLQELLEKKLTKAGQKRRHQLEKRLERLKKRINY